MNMGEFVYFWGLAANANLKAQATTAFGWTTDYENQLQKARLEFSVLTKSPTLYKDINYGGTSVSLTPGTYTLAQLQAMGISNDWVSSIKVQSGVKVELYQDDNFLGTRWTFTGDEANMVNRGCNDAMSSVKIY